MIKKDRNRNLFNTIFIYFLTSVVCAFLFLLITNTYYIQILQKNTREQYLQELNQLASNIETTFDEINRTTSLLIVSNDMNTVLTSQRSIIKVDYSIVANSMEAVQRFNRTKAFIRNTYVVLPKDDLVIGSYGTASIDEFFNIVSLYDNYPKNYWLNLNSQNEKYRILAPSYVTNTGNGNTSRVIPTIQFATSDDNFNNPLIVEIEADYIAELLQNNTLTDNSTLFIFDDQDQMISRSGYDDSLVNNKNSTIEGTRQSNYINNEELIELVELHNSEGKEIVKSNQKNYMVVSYKDTDSNYTFAAVIPYSSLLSESLELLIMPVIIFMIGTIVVLGISFWFSRKIYNPIHSVANTIKESYETNSSEIATGNDLDYLKHSILHMISDNLQLQEDLKVAIPYVCERYLISVFDNNEILQENEVKDFLLQYDFSFPNDYFIVIHSTLNFTENFYETHTKAEYNAICQSSLLIANEAFSAIDYRYIFSIAADQICVILNLDNISQKSKITASILKYHKALNVDEEKLTIHSGVGRLYEGYSGLKQSYNEALSASSQITYMTISMIRTYTQSDDNYSGFRYTINEENQLLNYLLQGDKTKALALFDKIINKNIEANTTSHGLKELYLQMYNTGIRVMNRRNLNIYEVMGEEYNSISTHIGDLGNDDLYHYIKTFFTNITVNNSKANKQSDLSSMKQYLDDHYMKEIYLDSIAEYFGKSSKYMSKYIKQTLGISFQDYISGLRIEKAKELLSTTKKSVNAIALEVGFNSRHPFIRKFKILEGVTPTEYRKLHK